jgi:thiol-disulfide isomerase/thioredoxin
VDSRRYISHPFSVRQIWCVFLIGGLGLLTACGNREPEPVPPPPVTPGNAQDVLRAVHEPGAKAVLVNMWASWCGPCREEFPDLVRVQREFAPQGLRVVFVSWDDTTNEAAAFLGKRGVSTPSFLKLGKQSDQDFLAALDPKLTGALPTTLIYDGKGRLLQSWEEEASYDKFKQAVQKALSQN